jgi:hypothetical protein
LHLLTPVGAPLAQPPISWQSTKTKCQIVEAPGNIPDFGSAAGCSVSVSSKKGVGTWYFPNVNTALAEANVSWYYTWQPKATQSRPPRAVEFVPMIWSETFVKPKELQLAKESGSILLGFNEPDRADQANITVEDALNLWPQLMATGVRLGSPAPAENPSLPGSWLDRFINGARARGYRADLLAVHWYGEEFDPDEAVEALKNFLEAVYQKFQLTIWLTEHSLIRWTDPPVYPSWEQQAAFAAKSAEMLV